MSSDKGKSIQVDTVDCGKRRSAISAFVRSPFHKIWREKTVAVGGCAMPVHMSGTSMVVSNRSGVILHERTGQIMTRCGTRRAGLCPSCADLYAADAYQLIRAGLTGDKSKEVSSGVSACPRLFVTLTAPGFGAVHSRRVTTAGLLPCRCGRRHGEDSPMLGQAISPETYDYEGAVLWQAHSGALWHRWCIAVRRGLARAGGIPMRKLADHAVVSYTKVAEFQRRGLVHFHAVVRVDGPHGAGSSAPAWVTPEMLASVVKEATAAVTVSTVRPDGEVLALGWGTQTDIQPIHDGDKKNGKSAEAIAGYIAKYATKDTGATESGVDRRIKCRDHIFILPGVSAHHRRMMTTAWDLGDHPAYQDLRLRKWAHMLGFRGHFLSKSKNYSTTFTRLRATRRLHQLAALLESLDTTEGEITLINDWTMTRIGHADDVQRELAEAIALRSIQIRRNKGE